MVPWVGLYCGIVVFPEDHYCYLVFIESVMRVNGNCNVFYGHLHLAEWNIMYRNNILEDFENASPIFHFSCKPYMRSHVLMCNPELV